MRKLQGVYPSFPRYGNKWGQKSQSLAVSLGLCTFPRGDGTPEKFPPSAPVQRPHSAGFQVVLLGSQGLCPVSVAWWVWSQHWQIPALVGTPSLSWREHSCSDLKGLEPDQVTPALQSQLQDSLGTSLRGSDITPSAHKKMPTYRLGVVLGGERICYSFVPQNGIDKHWVRRGRRKRGPDPALQELKMAWIQSLLQGLQFSFMMNGIRVLVQAKYCRPRWC